MKKLYILGAASMPIILLFNLYNRQENDVYVIFSHVLILALLLSLSGLFMFLVLKRFVGAELSIILLTLLWAAFWFFGALRRYVFTNISGTLLVLLIVAALALVLVLLQKFKPPLKDFSPVFGTLSIVFVAMLLINATPAIYRNIMARAAVEESSQSLSNTSMRRSFEVNHSLPMPDIYWIHLDGMISLEAVEYFFDICQENTRQELANRGFLIYDNAYLRNSAGTAIAMPMLLSPGVYDSFFGEILDSVEEGLRHEVEAEVYQILGTRGISIRGDINPYFELLVALLYRGYRINGFNAWWNYLDAVRISGEDDRGVLSKLWDSFARTDLPYLLLETTPLPLGLFLDPIDVVYLNMPETYQRADFTWTFYNDTHGSLWYWQVPSYGGDAAKRIYLYPLAHELTISKMLEAIDEITQNNPNAIIVLQSDHGFHLSATQFSLIENGVSRETTLLLAHSVFSAVRLPEAYGGLDEPVHPLNITRLLVNRFVGENYELLERN